jgi:rhodanese-related sulfurtransferase
MLTDISPRTLAARLKAGDISLIDVREADERAREHIAGTISLPLSDLERGHVDVVPRGAVAFHCKSGMRTGANCGRLAAHVEGEAFMLTGGLDAWKKDGLPVVADISAPLELQRQVQIAIGALLVLGATLATLVHPGFVALSAIMGLGLLNAGITGWCGLAKLIALAPWNRPQTVLQPAA